MGKTAPNITSFQQRTDEARDFLREARLEAYNYAPKELAKMVGVSVSTIYTFRSGKVSWPRGSTLFPILEALGYELRLVKRGKNDWNER